MKLCESAKVLLNGQSLNINSQMAIAAAEMVHQLLNSQLKRMQVEVDICRGSMKSTPIATENIDRIVGKAKAFYKVSIKYVAKKLQKD